MKRSWENGVIVSASPTKRAATASTSTQCETSKYATKSVETQVGGPLKPKFFSINETGARLDFELICRCKLCGDVLFPYVLQCNKAHAMCPKCLRKMGKHCRVCKEKLNVSDWKPFWRNKILEGEIAKLTFPCKFGFVGCKQRPRGADWKRHCYKECEFIEKWRKLVENDSDYEDEDAVDYDIDDDYAYEYWYEGDEIVEEDTTKKKEVQEVEGEQEN